jgi:DNA modification methylase
MALKRPATQVRPLLEEFNELLKVTWTAPEDLLRNSQEAINGCSDWKMIGRIERRKALLGLINAKLKLTKERFQAFLDAAAKERVFFNYHEKWDIQALFDLSDACGAQAWLSSKGHPALIDLFHPLSEEETLAGLDLQLQTGSVTRKDARQCGVGERRDEVLRSLFGSLVFHLFPQEALHKHFNKDCQTSYIPKFYEHLLRFHSSSLQRDNAMIFLRIDEALRDGLSPESLRDKLFSFIGETYSRLANHCFLAILIKPFSEEDGDGQWKLFSDLVLYAEKHREVTLKAGYFHPDDIRAVTERYIPDLDTKAAKFEVANEGFFFRDCFVLSAAEGKGNSHQVSTSEEPTDILLLFDKNERDETPIPCPGCRSLDHVSGNSYPALGVRSWECRNPICPDRSAFDRGNRYSLSALIKQEAISSQDDQIPDASLKKWKLDLVAGVSETEIVEMILRHFTLHGDTAVIVNGPGLGRALLGRNIRYETFNPKISTGSFFEFQESAMFQRFVVDRKTPVKPYALKPIRTLVEDARILHGDCFEVLSSLDPESIDAAVTSPPYYNAKSYAVWPNIYCYLYDMHNSAKQVFRVLKPGAVYLFNIFDYFDNENNIVLSAMGKKRMILGAYIINLFRRTGFELDGNVAWYKGEIEGKRNFNQGNKSPYYQYPFNCWEHTFVFRKPGQAVKNYSFPTVLNAKPVIKMIKGENVLGHSAPFPVAIPELVVGQMEPGQVVLDPFGGSMTTARAALRYGVRSISVEIHEDYCLLGKRLIETEDSQNDLFPDWEQRLAIG